MKNDSLENIEILLKKQIGFQYSIFLMLSAIVKGNKYIDCEVVNELRKELDELLQIE